MLRTYCPTLLTTLLLAIASSAGAQAISVTQTQPAGIYAPGETVTFTLTATDDLAKQLTNVTCTVKQNMLKVVSETQIDLSKGPVEVSGKLDEPGTLNVSLKFKPDDKLSRYVSGAVYSPDQLKPSVPPPDDFDAFWKQKTAAVDAVTPNALVEPLASDKPAVEIYRVRLDNVNGTHVYGQLAKPARPGKLPAVVIFQAAGVGPLPRYMVVPRAMQGYLAFNIMAHDLPMDADEAFYKNANATTHKNYVQLGNDDREKSYFLRMYQACYQAVRYVTTRDDWDGRTLIVMGTSQGGMQALATGGLHPQVTAVLANVPAGCDAAGPLHGRATGFPYWRGWGREPNAMTIEVGRYFDAANFATRIKVPTLLNTGLADDACPAACVLSAYNVIPGPKERIIAPNGDHHGSDGTQAAFWKQADAYLAAFARGTALPPPLMSENK